MKHVLKSDLAARCGLTGFVLALIYNEFNEEVVLALSKEILEIIKSDALQSIKEVTLSQNLTFADKFILLRIKLESLLRSPLYKGGKRLNLIIIRSSLDAYNQRNRRGTRPFYWLCGIL